EAEATPVDLPEDVPVTVEGDLGQEVSVEVDEDAEEPAESETFALSQGSGEKVEEGDTVVVAYTLTTWDNELTESSSMSELGPNAGPQMLPVGAGSALDLVEGYEVGSRVLIIQTAVEEMPPMVVVAGILDALYSADPSGCALTSHFAWRHRREIPPLVVTSRADRGYAGSVSDCPWRGCAQGS